MVFNLAGNKLFSVSSDGFIKVWKNTCKNSYVANSNSCSAKCPYGYKNINDVC